MDKIKVKKSNRVLMVPAEDKDRYLMQGYEIYSEDGKLIAKPQTDTEKKLESANKEIASLKKQLEGVNPDAVKEVEAIKAENAALKEEIASLKKQLEGAEADNGDGKKGKTEKPTKTAKAE